MKKIGKLKEYFVPDDKNQLRPYLLRKKTVILVFLVVSLVELLFILSIFNIIPFSKFLATIFPNVLVDLTNTARQEHSLHILKPNFLLEQAAQLKANDMAQKGYFSHNSPEGITPWHWFDEVGYPYTYAGENLAVNFSDSGVLHQAWLDSPSHKANIVNANFTEIGIGTATGMHKGKEAVFVVQLFGRQGSVAPIAIIEPEEIKPGVLEEESIVLGETTQDNSFISIQRSGEDVVVETDYDFKAYSSLWSRIFSSPERIISYILFFFVIIMGLAILFEIVTKVKIHFPSLIVNGLFVIVVIAGDLFFNDWVIQIIGQVI
ncbi:MAG: CAP domain-containing protein [Candidatus Pacebacteria bacterium]|nr:CAP domain-containing protein [Candidatus Paceibacterota bacterium]